MSRFRNVVLSEPLSVDGVRLLTMYSPALKSRADLTVYLPEGHESAPLPLLILLHGVYGSHWNWWALGNAPQTAQAMLHAGEIRPFAIAMPKPVPKLRARYHGDAAVGRAESAVVTGTSEMVSGDVMCGQTTEESENRL